MVIMVKLGTSKWSLNTPTGKFRNPFKNLNLIIALVILGFTLLHILTFYITLPPGLLFPKMPCGFDMVTMCAMFILFNSDAKEHAFRKCQFEVGCQLFRKNQVSPKPTPSVGNDKDHACRLFTAAELNQTNGNIRNPRAPKSMDGSVLKVENLDEE